jgi:hypothetical protein
MTNKIEKKYIKFHILKYWMFSLVAEGFSCSLDVLYEDLGISKLQILIQKFQIYFSCKFFSFLVIKTLYPD